MLGQDYLKAMGGCQPLSEVHQQSLDHQGFTLIESLIDDEWLEALREAFDRLVAVEGSHLAREHHQEAGAIRIANLVNKGTVWEKVWCHPLVLSVVHYVFKSEFKLSSLNAREALKGAGHQPLHTDWKKGRQDFPKVHVVNVLWALDDMDQSNGAPRLVPGTHLQSSEPGESMKNPLDPHPDEIQLSCKAGSVVVFNAHLWHGGTINQTGRRRRVLHDFFTLRQNQQQQNQKEWLTESTAQRLTPAQKWLLDVS
ncbi:phytanoyl-CoA dioxygenase family protein [Endozoicomonas arenosclerae]|uniref:phytanoyl-CoA dioxygenase family protein n=1 Tax=Endozoicomonas arenosclerae TaxID=1633495 RepID=UPI000781A59D|nr:phytanoyl-CoA dioxygenase family protein [Endozoicomonas arenosclerae]